MKLVPLSRLSLIAFLAVPALVVVAPLASVSLAATPHPIVAQSEAPRVQIVPDTLAPQFTNFLERVIAAKQSEKKWRRVVAQEPKNAEAYRELADALNRLKHIQEAETFYQQAIEIAPTDESLYVAYGDFLMTQARSPDAVVLYQTMTETLPKSAIAQLKLALTTDNIYLRRPFPEQARSEVAYREAIRLDPTLAYAYQMLGDQLKRLGRLSEAEEILQTAFALEPENYAVYESLADVIKERSGLIAAEAVYKAAIAANPQNIDTHRRFAKWLFKNDRSSLPAKAAYQQAIEQFPEAEGLYKRFSSYLIYEGQPEEAIALLNEAIERGITEPFIYSRLAEAFVQKGQLSEAEAALRKTFLMSPKDYYKLANFLEDNGRIEEAIVVCQDAIAKLADNRFAYYQLGQLYLENGQVENAIATHQESFQIHNDTSSALSLAEVLLDQDQYAEAESLYRQFVGAYASNSIQIQRWKRALVALDREGEADSLEQYLNAQLATNWTATYREAVRIAPESGYYYHLLGESLEKLGQTAAAEAAYREAEALAGEQGP